MFFCSVESRTHFFSKKKMVFDWDVPPKYSPAFETCVTPSLCKQMLSMNGLRNVMWPMLLVFLASMSQTGRQNCEAAVTKDAYRWRGRRCIFQMTFTACTTLLYCGWRFLCERGSFSDEFVKKNQLDYHRACAWTPCSCPITNSLKKILGIYARGKFMVNLILMDQKFTKIVDQ